MDYVRWLLTVLAHHKDAIVAVAALLAPFAAVFAALRASARQSRASLEAAKRDNSNDCRPRNRSADRDRTRSNSRVGWRRVSTAPNGSRQSDTASACRKTERH